MAEFLQTRDLLDTFSLNAFEALGAYMVPMVLGKWMMAKQIKTAKTSLEEMAELFGRFVDQHKRISDDESPCDMIDVYLKSQGQFAYCKQEIVKTFPMFIPDASRTAVEMTMWLSVYLVNHPESQQDIYDEVQRVCGSEGVSLKKRPEMPITESFIMEVCLVSYFLS